MNLLTNNDLETLLLDLQGKPATFVRLESKTKARATVKSRTTLEPFYSVFGTDTVWKVDSRTVLLNASYEKVVNRRREKEGLEGDFESKGTYGNMIGKCLIEKDDGAKNVRFYYIPRKDDVARWVRADGTLLSPDLVERLKKEFLPVQKEGSGRQGLESANAFRPLDFKMESIRSLRMKGVEYIMAGV